MGEETSKQQAPGGESSKQVRKVLEGIERIGCGTPREGADGASRTLAASTPTPWRRVNAVSPQNSNVTA